MSKYYAAIEALNIQTDTKCTQESKLYIVGTHIPKIYLPIFNGIICRLRMIFYGCYFIVLNIMRGSFAVQPEFLLITLIFCEYIEVL